MAPLRFMSKQQAIAGEFCEFMKMCALSQPSTTDPSGCRPSTRTPAWKGGNLPRSSAADLWWSRMMMLFAFQLSLAMTSYL
ncbi:hypothetical protein D3C78_1785800 [compost metagenome]